MKTLADLKRRFAIPDIRVTLVWFRPSFCKTHKYLNVSRKVEKLQTESLRFEGGSWLQYPKANEVYFFDADTFAILENGKVHLVYSFDKTPA